MALKWEEAASQRITEAQARRVLSDIHEAIHGTRLESPAVTDYVAQWLGRKQGEVAGVTLQAYRHAAQEFATFLGDRASQPIHYVTPAQIAVWRDSCAKKATPRTANNKLTVVRVLFQSAWRDGLLTENPAAKVGALKANDRTRRPFTLPELKRVGERIATVRPESFGFVGRSTPKIPHSYLWPCRKRAGLRPGTTRV